MLGLSYPDQFILIKKSHLYYTVTFIASNTKKKHYNFTQAPLTFIPDTILTCFLANKTPLNKGAQGTGQEGGIRPMLTMDVPKESDFSKKPLGHYPI